MTSVNAAAATTNWTTINGAKKAAQTNKTTNEAKKTEDEIRAEITQEQKEILDDIMKLQEKDKDAIANKQNMDQDQFLHILITQMQNQDPMNPMQDQEFIAQMAQFSQVEQTASMNTKLEDMTELLDNMVLGTGANNTNLVEIHKVLSGIQESMENLAKATEETNKLIKEQQSNAAYA